MRHNNKSYRTTEFCLKKFQKFFDSLPPMKENNNSFKVSFIVAMYDFVEKMIPLLSKPNLVGGT